MRVWAWVAGMVVAMVVRIWVRRGVAVLAALAIVGGGAAGGG